MRSPMWDIAAEPRPETCSFCGSEEDLSSSGDVHACADCLAEAETAP